MTTPKDTQALSWQQQLAMAIRDPLELLTALKLNPDDWLPATDVTQQFHCRVPMAYLSRIQVGDPYDPLLRQVLPLNKELEPADGFGLDPLQELDKIPTAGIIHKYTHRALITLTGACAINCRYCFRRHFPYKENSFNQQRWQNILRYIKQHSEINEIILSGGDPLILKDEHLARVFKDISDITHIRTLRIHTRLPIVIPDRISQTLLKILSDFPQRKVIVLHCNHANEIDHAVSRACQHLVKCNITLLNQSVLLKGVNDSVAALVSLSERLFENHIIPYYLHLLDPVQGAAHFAVCTQEAIELIAGLRQRLPGYGVPRLVADIPNQAAKTIIA